MFFFNFTDSYMIKMKITFSQLSHTPSDLLTSTAGSPASTGSSPARPPRRRAPPGTAGMPRQQQLPSAPEMTRTRPGVNMIIGMVIS
jgi:hypothetical protein